MSGTDGDGVSVVVAAAAGDLHPIRCRMLGFVAVVAFSLHPWT